MSEKKIRFLKGLSTGLVVAAIVFAFLIAGIRIFGVQVYGVLTGSMEPAYPTGSLIYVKDVDASELRVNDVITFSVSPGVIATHRIVQIVPDENNPSILRYRTKGDANRDVDAALVGENNIIGKAMFAIRQLGYLASYIQQSPGIYVAILVCGLMIAFVFYTDSLDSKQKEQNQAQSKEDKQPYYPQQYPAQYGQMQPGQQGYPQYNGMPQYPQQGQWQQGFQQNQQAYPPQQGYYPQQQTYPMPQARSNPPQRGRTDQEK